MTIKRAIFTPCPRLSLARFTFCCWCHNRLLMTSQCKRKMWHEHVKSDIQLVSFIFTAIFTAGRVRNMHIHISYNFSTQRVNLMKLSPGLTWLNCNSNMDKKSHPLERLNEITYPFRHGAAVEVWEWISNFIHTLLGIWLLIHAGIKVDPRSNRGSKHSETCL